MEETTLTRREAGALAIIGAMAAAILPPSSLAESADHELIKLGREIGALWAAHSRAAELSEPTWRALDEWGQTNRHRRFTDDELYAAQERIEREIPLPRPNCDEITDAMDAPLRRIMALKATTPAGLAVKAQVIRREFGRLWEKPFDDLEWHDMHLRSLVDAVLSYPGTADGRHD